MAPAASTEGLPGRPPSEVAAACFAAFGRRDVDAFLRLVHEDVVWRPASTIFALDPAQQRPYHGHAGVRSWFEHVAGWAGYEVRTLHALDAGSFALISAVTTLADEEQWLARAVVFVFRVEDGRVRDLETLENEAEARSRVGLPPVRAELDANATACDALTLPPDRLRLATARARLRAAAGERLSPEALNDLLVAATEALTNAVTHSGGDGPVDIEWGVEEELFAVCVRDRGNGTPPSGSLGTGREDHGRGMAVMRLLVDDLVIESSRAGTSVRLAKRLANGAGA